MTYFVLPHVHKQLVESNIEVIFSDDEQPIVYNTSLASYLSKSKELIHRYAQFWDQYKRITNPFEFIHTVVPGYKTPVSRVFPLSRAYFKFVELSQMFELHKGTTPIKSFHLAEGPGGFIQAQEHLRRNPNDMYYGMTLVGCGRETPGWKKIKSLPSPIKNLVLETGADGTGNLFNLDNFKDCVQKYANTMDTVTADGGFDFSVDFNKQESNALSLVLVEVCYAIMLQKHKGNFVLKLFDMFLKPTVDILYLLSLAYEEVHVVKPNTSRYANSERYIVCKRFKPDDSRQFYPKFCGVLEQIGAGKPVQSIVPHSLQYFYRINIQEINSVLGQQQIENINSTIVLIEQDKRKDKIEAKKRNNATMCVEWCKMYNVPYNQTLVENNIFLNS